MDQDGVEQLARVIAALETIRCGAACSEEELHALAREALARFGLEAHHEVRLAPRCRIDLMCGSIGIEIKKSRPQTASLVRQLTRYAACPQVEQLLVIAPRAVRLPKTIAGKPVTMMGLERLWGISLP